MIRLEFRAVGTTCSAAVTEGGGAKRALEAARAEVELCEAALSRFRPDSDLSRLNAADGRWVAVDERLREALVLALRAREATNGRFDPTVLPALAAAGYDRSFDQLEVRAPRPLTDWRAGARIEVDGVAVRLERGAAVDLGGIGKGYAADRALAAMLATSPRLAGALVDLGGDIAVHGDSPEGGPWLVAVADPRRAGNTLAVLALYDGGVATSGRDARRFGPARSLHHLIDPETGEPALAGPLTVTVVGPDAATAEGHATTLAIAGLGEAEAHVAERPSISALFVPHTGPAMPLGDLPLALQRLVVSAA